MTAAEGEREALPPNRACDPRRQWPQPGALRHGVTCVFAAGEKSSRGEFRSHLARGKRRGLYRNWQQSLELMRLD